MLVNVLAWQTLKVLVVINVYRCLIGSLMVWAAFHVLVMCSDQNHCNVIQLGTVLVRKRMVLEGRCVINVCRAIITSKMEGIFFYYDWAF